MYREFSGGVVFFLGQGLLELSGNGRFAPSPDVAVWLQVRDITAAAEELRSRGADIEREPRREPWGLDEMWIRDPDGVRIVLVEIPADHPLRIDVRTGNASDG